MRGDLNTPATSPFRDRPIEESLDLFERMKNGEFEDNKYTLRAKIDLASGNFNMRDPVIYRIRHMHHHRQGDKWCIYPMYDLPIPSRMLWRASPIPCALWNLRTTDPSTTGWGKMYPFLIPPVRSSSPAWASTTPCSANAS